MRRSQLGLLVAAFAIGAATAATAHLSLPDPVRVGLGVLIVFAAPGFALVCAARPTRPFNGWETALSSIGLSLAIATGAAVLLAALPVGLTRASYAIGLGAAAAVLSVIAAVRTVQ